ncbi:MAG: hypothetical protein EHM64_07430 [Ignavibacteriae bacterium]|nr:MAG: hypothetical protein EHM64_07430 [Ignavibacteriota bacterium]
MKTFIRFTKKLVCLLALGAGLMTAQDLQQQLSKLGHDAAVGYITPILSGWGNDLNSGIYYSADLHDVLGFDIGVKFAMSQVTDADKTFSLTMPATMTMNASDLGYTGFPSGTTITLHSTGPDPNYPASVTANTAVGAKEEVLVKTLGGFGELKNGSVTTPVPVPAGRTILPLPPGYDWGKTGVPLPMPQLNVGLPFGIEFMLRYIPTVSNDAGKFSYMGFGLRYNIDQWIPFCPVDIAVHFMTQKMNFKSKADADIFSATGTAYGFEASKKLFIVTLYGGFQLENSTLTLNDFQGYNPEIGQSVTIPGFEVKGSNKSRITVGARLLLLIVNVHAEYSIAKNPVITLGAGISIR